MSKRFVVIWMHILNWRNLNLIWEMYKKIEGQKRRIKRNPHMCEVRLIVCIAFHAYLNIKSKTDLWYEILKREDVKNE